MTIEYGLLKLAQYNRTVRETFDIVAVPEDHTEQQYFVLYGMTEGESFVDTNIRGVFGTEALAKIIAGYRQDGVLRIPTSQFMPHLTPTYEHIQPLWCYFLTVDSAFHKVTRMELVEELKEEAPDGL